MQVDISGPRCTKDRTKDFELAFSLVQSCPPLSVPQADTGGFRLAQGRASSS